MGDTNELMEFLSASLGATLDEIYQRLIDCDFTREDPGLAMFVVALLNALGREGRGNRPTEVVLMLAFGESGTAERGRNRLMRWRRGEMSGHDLVREPGLGEQRDHRLGESPYQSNRRSDLMPTDLGALERDLLEYRFSEDDDGEVDGSLLLMAPSSFMSPTKEASADLSPMDPISQARECRSRDPQKLLYESPRRRKIEESMKISFLSTLPEEEWERYQMELEGKTGAIWSRVNFMEKSWDVIRRYGTQSIMKVGLNQPIMREVLEKIVSSMESDVLTESVTEDSADDQHVAKKLPVRRARKGLKRLKGKTGSRAMNPRVVKSRASAVVTSLTSAGRSGESGQGDSATLTGGEKENLIPPMLLAGLTVTATRSKKTAQTLADTK